MKKMIPVKIYAEVDADGSLQFCNVGGVSVLIVRSEEDAETWEDVRKVIITELPKRKRGNPRRTKGPDPVDEGEAAYREHEDIRK